MKKVLILLLMIFVLTGCNIKELDSDNFDIVIESILKDGSLTNTIGRGYKYYIPAGVKLVESTNYNEKLQYNNDYYYLYVDVVGYYYKTEYEYEIKEDVVLSKKIEHNDKKGYIEITEKDGIYFIEALYNYAKIEAYVNEKNLKDSFLNIMYTLSSVKFNDYVTELMLKKDILSFNEEKFDAFKSRRKSGSFLDYVTEFDDYKEEIEIDGNIGNED